MGFGGHGHSHGDNNAHGHSHGEKPKKFLGLCVCTDQFRLACMLCMTLTFFFVELIVGHISHSISLTADSFHMLSDALALVIGLFTTIISKRQSSKNTYGWVRAEVLGPLINSVFLISLCFSIVVEAIERLFSPETLKDIDLLLYVGIFGLCINLAGMFLFGHGHSHNIPSESIGDESDDEDDDISEIVEMNPLVNGDLKVKSIKNSNNDSKPSSKPKKRCCVIMSSDANMNMRAVFLHIMADALGSVIVIISALLNKFQDELHVPKKIIDLIDPVLCLCLVFLILSTALPLLKESALILLQTVPKQIEVSKLKKDLTDKIPGISNIHDLHIWKLSGRKIIATAHITFHNSEEYMQVASRVKDFFHKRGIHSTTIQPEFTDIVNIEHVTSEEVCLLECMKNNTNCIQDTCCGENLIKNKSVASQLKNTENLVTSNGNNGENKNHTETVNQELSSTSDSTSNQKN